MVVEEQRGVYTLAFYFGCLIYVLLNACYGETTHGILLDQAALARGTTSTCRLTCC